MAKKKSSSPKPASKSSTMIKIAGKVGELAGKLVNQKNHLMNMAGGALDSVKTAVHDITTRELPKIRKTAVKKGVKKAAKKAVKKVSEPISKKVSKAASVKKTPSANKVVKNAVKKVAKKGNKKSPVEKK